jgi:hypothetical protein
MSDQTKPAADHPPEDDGNFLHVVVYAGIFLVIGLIAAFLIIKGVGRHILPGKHAPHPTSQLILPAAKDVSMAAAGITESPFIFPQQKIRDRV